MDEIFKALNDPARRDILDSLRKKDGQTLSQLEGQFDMTRFGVMKHLGVLEAGKLITTKKVGRFKHHYLNALPLQEVIDRWIEPLLAKPAATGLLNLKNQLEGNHAVPVKPSLRMETYIRCTQDALWEALTNADIQSLYHFTCEKVTRDGNKLIYYRPDDSVMLVCSETELDPKSRISSTFEPAWDETGHKSRYDYLIEDQGDFCKLALEHYDLVDVSGIDEGWSRWFASLKTYLETGEAVRFGYSD